MSPTRKTHAGAATTTTGPADRWRDRVRTTDWDTVRADLDDIACALTGPLLTAGGGPGPAPPRAR